jgi:16S rRNA (cytosine1402-N4)-methyltransferase
MKNAYEYHIPVLINEVLAALNVRQGGRYIDATLGDGGHAKQIVGRGGIVLGIDQDPDAINRAKKRLEREIEKEKVTMMNVNFDHIGEVSREKGFTQADGILFDLGMSSFQLASGRGFSFTLDEPLDMRRDPTLSVTAADLVNALGKSELSELFGKYGHESHATKVASAIVNARRQSPIQTTGQLSRIIEKVSPRQGKLHPATKIFMSLRIAINDELGSLTQALPQAVELLAEKGRLLAISFHEGEDRIVKSFIQDNPHLVEITESPVIPSDREVFLNPRSRSAKLRVAEKRSKQ